MSIIAQGKQIIQQKRRVGVKEGFDAIRSYKQEFYELYGELITAAMAAGCKHLIPTDVTSSIIALRAAESIIAWKLGDEIERSSEIADWQGVTAMMLDIQRKAEASDGDYCEVYHRAAALAHRASEIEKKLRRANEERE